MALMLVLYESGGDRAEARRRDHQERGESCSKGAERVAVTTITDRARRGRDPALLLDRLPQSLKRRR